MSTKILGNEELNILRAKTPYSLPDNPSDKGFNARQIKTKFWEGYLLLFNWLKETQASLNNDFATTNSALLNESKRIDVILTYFSDGKANFAVKDRNNNIIDETYELKSEASTKFNQLIADIQSVERGSASTITGTQNINADGIQYTITLSNTQNANLSTITQYLPLATTLKAGLLSSTDKEKINNIESDLTNFLANAKAYTDEKLQRDNIVNILGAASHTLIGLLSSEDKKKIDALYSLLGETEDADTVVNTINEVLAIFSSYPEGVDIVSQLEKKVNYTDVINTLDSEETSKPLSAKMGKELKTEVDTKAELAYVNEELDKKALKSDILVIDEAVTAQESEITTTQSEGDKLVDEIVGYIDGSPRGVYASLSALQSAFPSGTQGVYVCSDNGHWYYWSGTIWTDGGVYQATEIAENSIGYEKTDFTVRGKNLYDKSKAIDGYYISYTNGNKNANSEFFASDFIEIDSSQGYITLNIHNNFQMAFYDGTKKYISGAYFTSNPNGVVAIPSNAKYVRFCEKIESKNQIQLEYGQIKTQYEEYQYNFSKQKPISQETSEVNNENSIIAKTNLIDYTDSTINKYYANVSGKFNGSNCWAINNFIRLKPNTKYSIYPKNAFIDIFTWLTNSPKNVGGQLKIVDFGYSDSTGCFTTDDNHIFLYITLKAVPSKNIKLIEGDMPNENVVFGDKVLFGNFEKKTFYVGANRQFTKLKDGVEYASQFPNALLIVDDGTYDLVSEYGQDYLDNTNNDKGLVLKNGLHIKFSSKSKVIFNYNGSNAFIHTEFSPFNTGIYGGTLENMTLECSNCRYCIHDERGSSSDRYENRYINCVMSLDNSQNPDWSNPQNIGGGLGSDGYILIDGCVFGHAVTYHNNNGSQKSYKSHIIIRNNYFKENGLIISSYGSATDITEVEIYNNSLMSIVIDEGNVVNMHVTEWNNTIRK